MRLEPIGVSDLAAAGVNRFPLADPVADVVRANQSATGVTNQLVDLRNNQSNLQIQIPNPNINEPQVQRSDAALQDSPVSTESTRRQITDEVSISADAARAASTINDPRQQESLQAEVLPQLNRNQPEPVGVGQLNQIEQRLDGSKNITQERLEQRLEEQQLNIQNNQTQVNLTQNSTPQVQQPQFDTQINSNDTTIEFPAETTATNPSLNLASSVNTANTTSPQLNATVNNEFPPETQFVSGAPDPTETEALQTEQSFGGRDVAGQINVEANTPETPEAAITDEASPDAAPVAGANEETSAPRTEVLERTYTGASTSTTIQQSSFVAIG